MNRKMSFQIFIAVIAGFMLAMFMFGLSGCESCQRGMKSISSSATGLKRKVVWTGFDGTKKTWTGKFKLDSNDGSPTVYFISDGKTVVLGPGWYSEEIN